MERKSDERIMQGLKIEELSFDSIEELEEVITPGWGTLGCCTS